jgi:hypothetical protein
VKRKRRKEGRKEGDLLRDNKETHMRYAFLAIPIQKLKRTATTT